MESKVPGTTLFVATWHLRTAPLQVWHVTGEVAAQSPRIPRFDTTYSSTFLKSPFDLREMVGILPIDLATWLHRQGAWREEDAPF